MWSTDTERAAIDSLAFQLAPVGLWYEDFSRVEELCEELVAQGVDDLPTILRNDYELLDRFIRSIEVIGVNAAAAAMVGAPDPEALRGPLRDIALTPDARSSFITQIEAVWRGADHVTTEVLGAGFDGQSLELELTMVVPVVDGVPDYTNVLITMQDVTAQRAADRERIRHIDQLTALLAVSRQIGSSLDIDEVLASITRQARALVDSDESTIILFDSRNRELTLAMRNDGYLLADHTYQEIMQGISGWTVENGRSALSHDISIDPRNTGAAWNRAQAFPGTSLVVSPIIADNTPVGTITVLNGADKRQFTEVDQAVVESLASAAAIAISNARLYRDLQGQHAETRQAIDELQATQEKLMQAQKLEAIGSMASGIAHEINTPIQFVADNLQFLQEAVEGYQELVDTADRLLDAPAAGEMAVVKDRVDFEFLAEEAPAAISQALEGADRVAGIVRAMKDFAHPADSDKTTVDVNHAIKTTLEVSRGEWKHAAEVVLELNDDVPTIEALRGPLNQTLLILIVNAAQAVAETSNGHKGEIRIATTHSPESVEIRISDSGPGIPAEIMDRIFDPFFTTKEVGKGSGQGLAIARTCIVEQHGGEIFVDTAAPATTFVLRIPHAGATS
jgi:signal transduction histidine kinase